MPSRRQKVHFYRAEPRLVREAAWPKNEFPMTELATAINTRARSHSRYVDVGYQTFMALAGTTKPAYAEWSLYKVRRDQLPDEETNGRVRPLPLPATSNLAEGAHLVVFRRNIIGVLGRREAPGRGAICGYVEEVLAKSGRSVVLTPIIRPDVMALLTNAVLVSAAVRVTAGNAGAVSQANRTLGGAARDLSREASAESIEFVLRAGRSIRERRNFGRGILRMVRPVRNSASNQVDKLEVTYISEEAGRQVVDLLGDDITVNVEVDAAGGRRSVAAVDAYEAIRAAYREALEQLNQAIQLG